MDNILQIEEIRKYHRYLCETTGKEVDEETAALQWITNYAHSWRSQHIVLAERAE